MADVAVIGAGAAGLMAASLLAKAGIPCDLYEKKDRCGLKIGITGKGRCNVTNACDADRFRAQIMKGDRFLFSVLSRYDSAWLMDYFTCRGVPLKVERGDRVFPVSDRALDIVSALLRSCPDAMVTRRREEVTDLVACDGFDVITCKGKSHYGRVLLATGGLSYPQTGSTGDGYRFAKQLGHSIEDPQPSLVGLTCLGDECSAMSGLSLKNVTLSLVNEKGKKLYSDLGEALFTHFGISGPLALTASAYIAHKKPREAKIIIDLKPGLSMDMLDQRLLRDFSEQKNKSFKNCLGQLLPASIIPVMVARSGIDPDKQVNAVTRAERERLCELIKNFTFTVSGTRPIEEAVVTAGGVSLKEIDPKTMESKIVPGLYFAGEVMDVDALTGGFNLQLAFSTAAAAAEAMMNGG
jgi:predicted Rossmann fold flavoprotein